MTCVVDSEPAPTKVEWYFNDTGPLTTNSDYTIKETSQAFTYYTQVTSVITIFDVQRVSDVGFFTCRAINSVGQTDEKASLRVACTLNSSLF